MTIQDVKNLPPDNNGIIKITVDGNERRFVKEKFIAHLERLENSGDYLPLVKFIKVSKYKKVKVLKDKKAVGRPRVRVQKQKQQLGEGARKPIIAILPDGSEKEFPSRKEACDVLGIDPAKGTNISKVLTGKYRHVGGIKFKSVEEKLTA